MDPNRHFFVLIYGHGNQFVFWHFLKITNDEFFCAKSTGEYITLWIVTALSSMLSFIIFGIGEKPSTARGIREPNFSRSFTAFSGSRLPRNRFESNLKERGEPYFNHVLLPIKIGSFFILAYTKYFAYRKHFVAIEYYVKKGADSYELYKPYTKKNNGLFRNIQKNGHSQ